METKLLTEHYDKEEFRNLDGYKRHGGYEVLKKALKMQPQSIIDEVKASGLRGRGGAGFATGVKWGFLPKTMSLVICFAMPMKGSLELIKIV